MALTTAEIDALNNLPKYVPALADAVTRGNIQLGDVIAALESSLASDALTAIQAGAVVTAVADVSAVAAADVSAVAALTSAAASGGESPTEAEYNALRVDVSALRDILIEVRTLANELKADAAEKRALVNDLKAKYNALAAAIDGA